MFTSIPETVYDIIYSFLSPRELSHTQYLSREQSVCVTSYIKDKKVCPLCKDYWISSKILPFTDLEPDSPEIDIRINSMSRWIRLPLLCDSCQKIIWKTNNTAMYCFTPTDRPSYYKLRGYSENSYGQYELIRVYDMTQSIPGYRLEINLCKNTWLILYHDIDNVTYWNPLRYYP